MAVASPPRGGRRSAPTPLLLLLPLLLLASTARAAKELVTHPEFCAEDLRACADYGGMTAVVATMGLRRGPLTRIVRAYADLAFIKKTVIVWQPPKTGGAGGDGSAGNATAPAQPPAWLAELARGAGERVQLVSRPHASLMWRYREAAAAETCAVHIADDDLVLKSPAKDLGFMLRAFAQHPGTLVGPFRRSIVDGKYSWTSGDRPYSLVLSGFSVMHRCTAKTLAFGVDAGVEAEIERTRNCDDLAANFVAARLSGSPPLAVRIDGFASDRNDKVGLSRRGNHYEVRTRCIQWLVAAYGDHFRSDVGLRAASKSAAP